MKISHIAFVALFVVSQAHALDSLTLDGASGTARPVQWDTAGVATWNMSLVSGSDRLFGINAYNPTGGAYIGSPLVFDSTALTINRRWGESAGVTAAPAAGGYVGRNDTYTNSGDNGAQGEKITYFSYASKPGFDLTSTRIYASRATSDKLPLNTGAGTLGMAAGWFVAIGPNVPYGYSWGLSGDETDVVNRSANHPIQTVLSSVPNPVVAHLSVPEAQTFGEGGNTYNADFAYAAAASSGRNQGGERNKWRVPFFCDKDSITTDGYCLFANGTDASTPASRPYSPFGVGGSFQHGIDLTGATFGDSTAIKIAAGQTIGVGTASGITTTLHIGACMLTVSGGLITGQSGC